MNVIRIYKCLCDGQRLRILNLLHPGPLCVCHLMEIMDCDQVKMSKQLRYMKTLGMVECERKAQWMVYRLAEPGNPLLEQNLRCLQDIAGEGMPFKRDLRKRSAILRRLREGAESCAESLLAGQREELVDAARSA